KIRNVGLLDQNQTGSATIILRVCLESIFIAWCVLGKTQRSLYKYYKGDSSMADWQSRSEISSDVVFFSYVPVGLEKNSEEVFLWDLDKTYLDTTIDSLRGLIQTVLERAWNKRNIPGTSTLIRALSIYRAKQSGQKYFPIYFITASPPQMEERI